MGLLDWFEQAYWNNVVRTLPSFACKDIYADEVLRHRLACDRSGVLRRR